MIVQSGGKETARFVITMAQHTDFADQIAAVFGNNEFEPVGLPEVRYVIAHHDAGWLVVDEQLHINPDTGLPYHLTETPFQYSSQTMRGSPDFNAAHHPVSGLLSSMHTTGLLTGRYGISPPGILARLEGDSKVLAEAVHKDELSRQQRLRSIVAADSKMTLWQDEAKLFQAYKQLQFFDQIALYFNCHPEGKREAITLTSVPRTATEDTEVTITPRDTGVYGFSPFPFIKNRTRVFFEGRWMWPIKGDTANPASFLAIPTNQQTVAFTSD